MFEEFLQIDLPALLIVILASIQCALLGSYLLLKKQAVMIDAISHSVLPGIVAGAIFSGALYMPAIIGGALIAGLLAIFCVTHLQIVQKIEYGAAIGITFTAFFSLGVILLETQIDSRIHIDTQHVLYGALELTYWEQPLSLETMPTTIKTLFIMLCVTLITIIFCFKEFTLTIFDPEYAASRGYKQSAYTALLYALCALAAVSCFQATGSILIIALFVCPAACARLLTHNVKHQLIISSIIALLCAVTGYILSAPLPLWLGIDTTLNSAAAIACLCGLSLIVTIIAHKS